MAGPELEYVEHIKEAPMKCMVVSIENSSPHWHYEYEVFLVLRGIVLINSEQGSYSLEKGDIVLFNTREVHSIHGDKENLCLCMQFSPGIILEVYDSSFLFSLNTRQNQMRPETAALFRSILVEMGLLLYEKPDGYQFAVKSNLYRFIGSLFSNVRYTICKSGERGKTNEQLEEFDRINWFIKDHFKEDFTIDELCRETAMSRAKAFRVLKLAGSSSVKDLTNYYRVEYAKNLLITTGLTIPYIATESGFDSDSSFYRIFKEAVGIPPHQYRLSPGEKPIPMGIQGYAAFSPSGAVQLLREYL
jgi:AraC-like DNA-binding protein